MTRQIGIADITTAWSGPVYGAAYVTRKAPASGGSYSFMQADFDSNGNLIRTFDLASGRMDCYGVNSQGAAFVVAYGGAGADGNVLGHFAYRGQDSGGNYNTFCYVQGKATTVNNAGASLNSNLYLGIMSGQTAGAGNAQPNWGATLTGATKLLTFDSAGGLDNVSGSLTINAGGVAGITVTSSGVSTNLPVKIAQEQVSNKTANYTVQSSDAGTIFSTITAAGEVDFTLPTGMGSGTRFTFIVNANQTVKVIANTSQIIRVGSAVSTTAGNVSCATQGCCIELIWLASALTWIARSVTGTWTAA